MDENEVLKWLERKGTRRTVEEMARYGIEAKRELASPKVRSQLSRRGR